MYSTKVRILIYVYPYIFYYVKLLNFFFKDSKAKAVKKAQKFIQNKVDENTDGEVQKLRSGRIPEERATLTPPGNLFLGKSAQES